MKKVSAFPLVLAISLLLTGLCFSASGNSKELVFIDYDRTQNNNRLWSLNPVTGATSLLNTFQFSGGSYGSFTRDPFNALAYARSSDGSLYTFDLATGNVTSQYFGIPAGNYVFGGPAGLSFIDYDRTQNKNRLWSLNPVTGATSLLNNFQFSGGSYGSFISDPFNSPLAYARSSDGVLYTFDLATGDIVSQLAGVPAGIYVVGGPAGLSFIDYDNIQNKNRLWSLNPNNGATSLLNTFQFSSGSYIHGSFISDPFNNLAYARSGDNILYTFDLATGDIVSQLAGIPAGNYLVATVPEPSTYALLLLGGTASLWAFKRRKR